MSLVFIEGFRRLFGKEKEACPYIEKSVDIQEVLNFVDSQAELGNHGKNRITPERRTRPGNPGAPPRLPAPDSCLLY